MSRVHFGCLLIVIFSQGKAGGQLTVESAAKRYVSGVSWRASSVVAGDFSCRGRVERAILGTSGSGIVVAVFLKGTDHKPEVIRDSVRDAASIKLSIEGLDYDPEDSLGQKLPAFGVRKPVKG